MPRWCFVADVLVACRSSVWTIGVPLGAIVIWSKGG